MSDSKLSDAWRSQLAGDYTRAERLYREVLKKEPGSFAALYRLGFVCGRRGQFDEAASLMGEAARIDPRAADAHFMRGSALLQLARFDEAIESLDRAIALRPEFPEALLNRAAALFRLKRHAEAGEDYERLLRLDPDYPYARGNRLFCRLHGCDWRNLDEEIADIAAALAAGKRVVTPFDAKALSLTAADELRCATIWAEDQVTPESIPLRVHGPYGHERICLAYVADSFGEDPVSTLIAGVIEHHDRTRFEIVGVTLGSNRTCAMRDRIVNAFDIHVEGNGRSDFELASHLRELEVDIAVDLMGFTEGCRPGVLAARPAQVQVNYLGFPGTLGAAYADYIVADRIVIPECEQRHYRERVVYLPESYMCCDSLRAVSRRIPTREEAGLPDKGFVFASFNNSYKFAPRMFEVWIRLLNAVEGSVLWLPRSNPRALVNLSREAAANGIEPKRLVFAPFVPEAADHLARLSLADLFLDTLPYNAHCTASDALWAGLPVLTCEGSTFAGRVASSLLHAAGTPELVTKSLEDYEAVALMLARDQDALAGVRAKLAANRATCAAFDTGRFTRHLESAYRAMWERAERNLPPVGFAVGEVA